MQIKTIFRGTNRTLRIWASEILDLRLHSAFSNAALVANYTLIDDIEIDLRDTHVIRDSGLALLLMLGRKAGRRCGLIKLINCPEDLQARLSRNNLAGHFQFV